MLFLGVNYKFIPSIDSSHAINIQVVILASATLISSVLLYFLIPKKNTTITSFIPFILISLTSAVLIVTTGQMNSAFLSLWLLVSFFSGIFGVIGSLPIFLTSCIYAAIIYINGTYQVDAIVKISLISIIPIIIGSILWSSRDNNDGKKDREYKNLANELNEVASKSEVVINAIGDGVIAIDSKGSVQLINPAAQVLTGWGKQDALNLNYKSVLSLVNQKNEALDPASDPIQQVLNTNQQVRTNDLTIVTKTGKKIMTSLVVSPVGDIGSGIITVFRDITNDKTEEREQAEFISTASHEMRTPVASIEGYLGLALNPQTAQIDDRAKDFILKAHASAQHLGHLFQDLLDVTKADDGRMSNNPKLINIVTFIHEITQGLKQKASQKGLSLIYKPIPNDNLMDKTIVPIYYTNLDDNHIREIVNNLIENAIKYTPKGSVVVDVNGNEDYVIISVSDTGIGIPVEDMSHLFQKFYRVNNKDTQEIGGTGLGLYLSRRLAEMMGGRIWAESTYSKGSTFFLELPRTSNQEANKIKENSSTNQRPIQLNAQTPNSQSANIETPTLQDQPNTPIEKPHEVPRTNTLSPQQIAEYVARQKALIEQQNQSAIPQKVLNQDNQQTRSTQPVSIPDRKI